MSTSFVLQEPHSVNSGCCFGGVFDSTVIVNDFVLTEANAMKEMLYVNGDGLDEVLEEKK